MSNYYQALKTLVEKESYWLQKRVDTFAGKKYVIFPAGPTARRFYHTLLKDFGIDAEYFIDNNPELEGRTVCGKQILRTPWEKDASFAEKYVVLIPTMPKYYFQITRQLEKAGISTFMSSEAFTACQLSDRFMAAHDLLDDEESKVSYLAAIYGLLTFDFSFIRYCNNQYFAIKNFIENGLQIVADIGAYVGDTVEEYVKRGTEGVKIYAFEPFDKAFAALAARVERLKVEWALDDNDIVIVPAGVGAETKKKWFVYANDNMLMPAEEGDIALEIFSLDDYFQGKTPPTLIKADIEGGEMDMLRGAQGIIRMNKPKMTICIYHSLKDFAQIIEYVKLLVPEYHLAVRNHFSDYRETVLYCYVRGGSNEGRE